MPDRSDTPEDSAPEGKRSRALAEAAKRFDSAPGLIAAMRRARELLPGDSRFGDSLSTAGDRSPQAVGRRIAALTEKRPGVLREAGLSALQVWQAVSEAQGRGRGERELAIVFTDLVDFSSWALEAGDDRALDLLRDVGEAIEPPVRDRGGEVVKRLGDGMMAVFIEAQDGLDAIFEACERLGDVKADGYEARMRGGMHVGRPRKIGGDYLGVDVNVAARMVDGAGANEVLVSDRTLELLDRDSLTVRRKWRFKVKGVPEDLTTYSVKR